MVQPKQGMVHQVLSGDTFVVSGPPIQSEDGIQGARATKIIRLCGISAPESSSAFHNFFLSRKFLRAKLRHKQIFFSENSQEGSRHWCTVKIEGQDLALLIVQNGWAVATKEGTDNDHYSRLKQAMYVAQREKVGLHGLDRNSPPLVWRDVLARADANDDLTSKKMVCGVIDDIVQDGSLKVIVPPTEREMRYLGISSVRLLGLEVQSPLSRAAQFLLTEQLVSREVQLVGSAKTPPTIVPQLELMKTLVRKGLIRLSGAIDANLRSQLVPLENESKQGNLGLWPVWRQQQGFQVTLEVTAPPLELPPIAFLEKYLESKFGPVDSVEKLTPARALVRFFAESDAENCIQSRLDYRLEAYRGRRAPSERGTMDFCASTRGQNLARTRDKICATTLDPRVKQLCSMGFPEQVARAALVEYKWDVNLALDKLFSQPEATPAQPGNCRNDTTIPSRDYRLYSDARCGMMEYNSRAEKLVLDELSPHGKTDTATVETEVADDDDTVSSPEGSVTKNGDSSHRPPDLDMDTLDSRSETTWHEPKLERGVRVKVNTRFIPDSDDPQDRYLTLNEGDEVDLLVEDHSDSGWSYGRIGDTDGWFPRNCLGELDLVTAKYEFTEIPEDSRPYLKLHVNTLCIVEHRFDCGWWFGSTLSKPDGQVGVKGYFPANFVQ